MKAKSFFSLIFIYGCTTNSSILHDEKIIQEPEAVEKFSAYLNNSEEQDNFKKENQNWENFLNIKIIHNRPSELPIEKTLLKLSINNNSSTVETVKGVGKFNYKNLSITPTYFPSNSVATVEWENEKIDVTNQLMNLVFTENKRAEAVNQSTQGKLASVSKSKITYCSNSELLYVLNDASKHFEKNCTYRLTGYPLKVLQSIPEGILITFDNDHSSDSSHVFFLETKQQYADNDRIEDMLVRSIGIKKYTSVLGVGKSIHAFQLVETKLKEK